MLKKKMEDIPSYHNVVSKCQEEEWEALSKRRERGTHKEQRDKDFKLDTRTKTSKRERVSESERDVVLYRAQNNYQTTLVHDLV